MTNNDVLKRLRYTFDFDDQEMIETFKLVDYEVNRETVCDWLKKETEETYDDISDKELASFLNGFIIKRRGIKEGSPVSQPESRLTNNMIINKLKIALELKSDDMLELFKSEDRELSKHELSAFFRKPNHAKYKHLNDQYLRVFLQAIQTKYKN